MNAATEPLTRDAIDQFLSRLTDDQKRSVLLKLLRPLLASLPTTAVVYDENGRLLGDLTPVRPVPPGTKVGMSDEARAALAKTVCKTRAEWDAERAARQNAEEVR